MVDGYKILFELVDYMIKIGIDKVIKFLFKFMLFGIFGGVFIVLGGVGNIILGLILVKIDLGLVKFVGVCVFLVGFIMVVIFGFELFISNCLFIVVYINKKIIFI